MRTYTLTFTDDEVKTISRALSLADDDKSWAIIEKLVECRKNGTILD